jgi:3-phosphoshikimate 1-carboxyvinyltransferase
MILHVKPTSHLKGKVILPASKSYSIRAFIIAACGGRSTITRPSDCDDALVAMRLAKALGSKIQHNRKGAWNVSARTHLSKLTNVNVGESGTVLRFLLPLASLSGSKSKITGEGTLIGRPNRFLNETLRNMGVNIKGTGEKESVPIVINGGAIKGGRIEIDGSLSSQFVSALLISCARLTEDTHVVIKGKEVVSEDYIEMTCLVLKDTGIKVKRISPRHYFIKGAQTFDGLKNFIVPSDYGLAAFLLAGGALIPSHLDLKGHLNKQYPQADGHIMSFLKKMDVRFKETKQRITLKGPFQLRGGDFSLKACPDLVPIMAVLALFAKGTTRLLDVKHARAKESDRISDLRHELLKVGANIEETHDALIIHPQQYYKQNCLLDPHHDHRLAMAFSILGLKVGVQIKDIECVRKSYPGFVKDIKTLGAHTVSLQS